MNHLKIGQQADRFKLLNKSSIFLHNWCQNKCFLPLKQYLITLYNHQLSYSMAKSSLIPSFLSSTQPAKQAMPCFTASLSTKN